MKKFLSFTSMLALVSAFTFGVVTVQAATTTPQTAPTTNVAPTPVAKTVHHAKKHVRHHHHTVKKAAGTKAPATPAK